ncbi:MAG TPA: YCF48-related protein, partial [Gemmataceae bacterium]|nr:YCF48-related protein [Gemmataceae bacterium]
MKWQRSANNDLPGLHRVRFVDARTGFAVGDGTEQFPAGIFRTADAGWSWHAVAGPRCTSWLAADFQDDQTGALAGAWSRLGVLRQGKFARADWEDTPGGRAIQDLQVVGKRAVAVGQGGLILTSSSSAGGQWGYANLTLPTEVRACWDFHGVHWVGDQIWIVGRPGSVVLHSPDQGQSWEVSKTGQPLPLHGVFFASDQAGWAVGDFGTILNTADGGKNWRAQHRGGQRAAILFAAARPTALPVDALAKLGGDEGFLAAALRVTSADAASADPARASQAMRFAAAVRAAGGAAGETLWQFALPQHLVRADSKELIRAWNPLFADRAADEVLRQLVLAVRIWRPDVVVTDSPDATGGSGPCETLVVEALHKAFQLAADPKAFPEQIQFLHLEPWEVKKSYARWDSASNAQVQIDLTQVSDRLEASIRDFAAPALGLLADAPLALPTMRFFHLLDSRLTGADKHLDLMRGIEPSPTGVSRRAQPPVSPLSQDVEKSIRSRRNLESLVAMPANQLTDPNRMLAQIAPMLGGMHEDQAAPAAFAVANHYVRIGQWTMAREIFLHMVDRYPAHPLSADAYRWLIRHNTSGEARRRQEMGQFWVLSQTTVRPSEDYRSESIVKFREFDEIVKDQLTMLGDRTETRRWYQGSLDIGKRFAALGPLYATEPPIQFCLQAARRHLGDFEAARAWYQQFCTEHPDGPWRDAAAMELWLLNRTGMPPKPVAYCREASARPFLDGKFDDACWQGVKPLVLRNAVGDTVKDHPSEAWLAYDKDFLYVALRCRHPAERYVPPVTVRPRDADLRPFDHVSLLLDL